MQRRFKVPFGQRGQLLIPSLFVLPSLFLFLFLIVETGKLSREKIRHQFAVNAASFIEMSNYSEFLSRSAYVNGAFPQRIFAEGFATTNIDKKTSTKAESLFDIMFNDGDFPSIGSVAHDGADYVSHHPADTDNPWKIEFGGCGAGKNTNPPGMREPSGSACAGAGGAGVWYILSEKDALDDWLSWDDANDIYNLYVQIYTLLGQVEDAQYSVWNRLSGTGGGGSSHSFFRKSYYLNTLDSQANSDPGEGASGFSHSFSPVAYCIREIMFYGNKPTDNPFQPYEIFAPAHPIAMNNTVSSIPTTGSGNGLFHIAVVPQSDLDSMNTSHDTTGYPGYRIVQHYLTWTNKGGSPNYFNIDFDNGLSDPICGSQPCVHATANLSGGKVWPDPTPKFQTRLYP